MKEFNIDELQNCDLIIDAVYKGGNKGNFGDDPLSKIFPIQNQRGFRYNGSPLGDLENLNFIVLTSTGNELNWNDQLEIETGVYTYFGDNRTPGKKLQDTAGKGNIILENIFKALHNNRYEIIPPIFAFQNTGRGRDVTFLGLAVPGVENLSADDDLVAVWREKNGNRFQNYKSKFTILNESEIKRDWIKDIIQGNNFTENAPENWVKFTTYGEYNPLVAAKISRFRSKKDQLPSDEEDKKMIITLIDFYEDPFEFEKCAAAIFKLSTGRVSTLDLTRPWRDGGRDAVGKYKIGEGESSILVDFALEAKRFQLNNSVGVRYTSRLISRIRHRQFGVLITTSFVASQAYNEIIEDDHPIIIISAKDIIYILKNKGINTTPKLLTWLEKLN